MLANLQLIPDLAKSQSQLLKALEIINETFSKEVSFVEWNRQSPGDWCGASWTAKRKANWKSLQQNRNNNDDSLNLSVNFSS